MFIVFLIIVAVLGILGVYYLQQYLNKFVINYGKVDIKIKINNEIKQFSRYSNKSPKCIYIFGSPGSGKTTLYTYYCKLIDDYNKKIDDNKDSLKKKLNVYGNVKLDELNVKYIDTEMIGKTYIHDGYLFIDESSVCYNNRNIKALSYKAIEYFKKHRHYNVTVVVFSQSYNDTDITIRRLCDQFYLIKKSSLYFLNHHIILRRIKKDVMIDQEKHDVIEGYDFVFMGKYRFNAKPLWKYFSTYDRDMDLILLKGDSYDS